MKKLLLLALLLALCVLLIACPSNTPDTPPAGSTTDFPLNAVFPEDGSAPQDTVWKFYTVPTEKSAVTDYTALTDYADGKYTSGAASLANGTAQATVGTDVAYGFSAPKNGNIRLSLGKLQRAGEGSATLAVYKNGVRIWPVSASAYEVSTTDRADLLSLETSLKEGDILYLRVSAIGTAAPLALTPTVSYIGDAYEENADLELNRPTIPAAPAEGIGASLAEGAFALTGRTPSATPTEISSADFIRALGREDLEPGATYRLTDSAPLTVSVSRGNYDGVGCIIIAPGGVIFECGENTVLTNLTVITAGEVTVKNAHGLTVSNFEVSGSLKIEDSCSDVRMENCRVASNGTALTMNADSATVVDSYFAGEIALDENASLGGLYENCVFLGEDTAISTVGESTTVWYSTVRGTLKASGKKVENLLVAMNRFENLGGVTLNSSHNCVILLNELENVTVSDSTNSYVCSNLLYDTLSLTNVNYVIATRNATVADRVLLTNVKNHNGDNITDITARPEAGVNEDLLPHVNKDAFINMERKSFVRTADGNTLPIGAYIKAKAESNGLLIIAPGAYSDDTRIAMNNIQNFSVYAYGVLYEKENFFDVVYEFGACTNVSMYGLTLDMVYNGCGHMIVLAKDPATKTVTYRAAAGMLQDLSNKKYFSEDGNGIAFMGYRAGTDYPYADISLGTLTFNAASGLLTSTLSASAFEMIEVGDMMTCRANGNTVVYTRECSSMHFEDFSVLSGSIRCFWEDRAIVGASLERVLISPAPAKVIDEETYAEYLELQDTYGVDLGVYVDEWGNYRGTPAMTVTADSTHTTNCRDGIKATSCIFENLSDDGTNQQGFHGRLADFDPETGKVTYKNNLSTISAAQGGTAGGTCAAFEVGDTVCIYTSNGKLLCETPALSVTTSIGTIDGKKHYTVMIDPAALDPAELEAYDLSLNDAGVPRILIDNLDRNGGGFDYDNVVAQNIRSRGFLVKCPDNIIKYCTFRNIGMAAVGLIFEPEWGESGVANNTQILNCYFENTGYYTNREIYSPITVCGLGLNSDDAYLPYTNIVIRGNVIRRRATDYALYINSAKDVIIADNDFGTRFDETENEPLPSVYINYANGVTLDNNIYSPYSTDVSMRYSFNGHRNITGSDVGTQIKDDPLAVAGENASIFTDWLPHTDKNGNLVYKGAWTMGYASITTLTNFKPFKVLTSSNWYSESAGALWSTSGGIDAGKGYRFAALKNTNVLIRYTAERDGEANVRITVYSAPYASGSGSGDGLFAIFVNNEMVWPTKGGSYGMRSDWYRIDQSVTYHKINNDLSSLTLTLKEGDTVDFVAKQDGSWSAFAALPCIIYKTEE